MNTLTIDAITIRKDSEGRYCLNDFHKAAGGCSKDAPYRFTEGSTASGLAAILNEEFQARKTELEPLVVIHGGAKKGTYAVKELVYAYAMWISPSFHLKVIRVFEEYATNGMVMKPEVAQQAFDNPKVFMAKALMLAQETLEKYAQEIKELEHDRDHVSVRQFERELGIYLTRPQRNRLASYARNYCLNRGLPIEKEVMYVQTPYYQGDAEVNIYPVEALRYARDLVLG